MKKLISFFPSSIRRFSDVDATVRKSSDVDEKVGEKSKYEVVEKSQVWSCRE
jgi:hypothetical protein